MSNVSNIVPERGLIASVCILYGCYTRNCDATCGWMEMLTRHKTGHISEAGVSFR